MACHEIHSWTFCGIVGAFLDLGLAYLLLCGSTLAFFASKFLGIFGWHLPCPCNGLFGDPHGGKCLQRLLVDYPPRRISSVQLSVKSKFPFDSIQINDQQCQFRVRLLGDTEHCDGPHEMEEEASCSSISDGRRGSLSHKNELDGFRLMASAASLDSRNDCKGKGIVSRKPKYGLRRRRKAVVEHKKSSPVWVSHSPYSMSEAGHEISEEGSVPTSSARVAFRVNGEESVHGFEVNESFGESRIMEEGALSDKEFVRNVRNDLRFGEDEKNVIRVLEQALEEEQAARAALYLELEKERSAAASAADEAMAMILRLQKDKASIEMEARQYLRMVEEKSAYDAEEMDILKEIIVRREREKHFLEKEAETYRQMILMNNEPMEVNVNDAVKVSAPKCTFSLNSNEDPGMLQQICESIDKREVEKNVKTSTSHETHTVEGPNSFHAFVKEVPSSDWDKDANFMGQGDSQGKVSFDKIHPQVPGSFDDCNQEIQEKGMVSLDEGPSVIQGEGQIEETVSKLYKLNSPPKHGLLGQTIISGNEGQDQKDDARQCQGVEMEAVQNPSGTEINFPCDGEDVENHVKNSDRGRSDQHISKVEAEPSLYDVHVVDDSSKLGKEEAREEHQGCLVGTDSNRSRIHGVPCDISGIRISRIDSSSDQPSTSRAATESDLHRSFSDLTAELPPINNIHRQSFPFNLRRNSMSAVDNERLRLDTEVEWLRERLRIVQEGRGNLCFPTEHREREKIQLQLLEDIAKQLKEIRQLTEPGKTIRQVSLPPASTKVCSKKRRHRSVSLGLHDST